MGRRHHAVGRDEPFRALFQSPSLSAPIFRIFILRSVLDDLVLKEPTQDVRWQSSSASALDIIHGSGPRGTFAEGLLGELTQETHAVYMMAIVHCKRLAHQSPQRPPRRHPR
jgi:hypothetical protein